MHAVLFDGPEGNLQAVVARSERRARQIRRVIEDKGIETRGIIRVVSLPEAII